jgi:hypothetical protein
METVLTLVLHLEDIDNLEMDVKVVFGDYMNF